MLPQGPGGIRGTTLSHVTTLMEPPRPPVSVLVVVLVAALYATCGGLALLLAIPPGYAAPFWPAAGVAAGAVLVRGTGVWPGIFLGSLIINAWVGRDAIAGGDVGALAASALIAAGAVLQAIVSGELIRRFAPGSQSLDNSPRIAKFLLLTGPVACLVNATIGPTVLRIFGVIAGNEWTFNWWSWWVGDTIGVILVAPLAIIWSGGAGRAWKRGRLHITLPAALAVVLVVLTFVSASHREQRRIDAEFDSAARVLDVSLRQRLEVVLDAVVSLQGLYDSSHVVTRDEFRAFTRRILDRHPELLALSWNAHVTQQSRPLFEGTAIGDGRRLAFFEHDERGERVPSPPKPSYTIVTFIEPFERNAAAIGFDVSSEPVRRAAIERAIVLRSPAATGRLHLVQDDRNDPGLLVFAPIYSDGQLEGFAVAVLLMSKLLGPMFDGLPLERLNVALTDAGDGSSLGIWPDGQALREGELARHFDIAFAGRTLRLTVTAGADYVAAHRAPGLAFILAGGLLMSAMLAAFLMVLTGHVRQARRRAAALTRANAQLEDSIAQRQRTEAALAREKIQARATLDAIADGVIATDGSGRVDYMNPVAEALTGWALADARGRPLPAVFCLLVGDDDLPVDDPAEWCLAHSGEHDTLDGIWLIGRGGHRFAIRQSARAVSLADGQHRGTVIAFQDVTRTRQLVREIAHQASHDPLTGLINRVEFDLRLARAVASARERGAFHALCFLDLDHFKYVNDSAGHTIGDELLRRVCAAMRDRIRDRDTLARLGGDEFALILEHCPMERAGEIARDIVDAVSACRIEHDGESLGVGVSIGLVELNACTAADAVRYADQACYAAKRQGRNRVVEFDVSALLRQQAG